MNIQALNVCFCKWSPQPLGYISKKHFTEVKPQCSNGLIIESFWLRAIMQYVSYTPYPEKLYHVNIAKPETLWYDLQKAKKEKQETGIKVRKIQGKEANQKIEGTGGPECFLKEGGEKEREGKRSTPAHFWGHYRREWLPFVPPWHLRGSLITQERGAGRGERRESPPQGSVAWLRWYTVVTTMRSQG